LAKADCPLTVALVKAELLPLGRPGEEWYLFAILSSLYRARILPLSADWFSKSFRKNLIGSQNAFAIFDWLKNLFAILMRASFK